MHEGFLFRPSVFALMLISFPYIPYPEKDIKTGKIIGEVYRPVIPIRIVYKHQFLPYLIDCLVDSGADRNLFPAIFGEMLKIKIKSGKPRKISGIGESEIEAYAHEVTFLVGKLGTPKFKTTIDFAYEQKVALLGRNGFFNFFKHINFKEREKTLELETS